MAANSSSRGIANFGKRVVNQIWIRDPTHQASVSSPALSIRAVHNSAYDKNPDEQIRPSVVPDELIQPQSDKYWAPHPKTGVFGPATEGTSAAGGERGLHASSSDGGEGSVLEQKAWFRPTSIEDLEKPHHN
ncbi:hypothetical protein FEM48_Zijuj03G0193400 [Ziziphus jujuba var. spinosa]|uniref:Late embryogenesis abundant protein At5g17165-like n=1 Tax=Ziziphus jujuba var. spinosa TaxID=714518 RepID=A0A978VS55_ZIZJJ|nr:hypothetical protein FEM48_Zijuj03G0193400 [Ziziphus jujuba var. spinosa]